MSPTLSAFRLGEPTPSCHKLWRSLSPGSAWRVFLHPPPLAPPHPKAQRDECCRTRAAQTTDRLRNRDPGDPERLRLARPSLSRRETASAKRNRSSAAARTPSSQAPDARPVRVVGLPRLLSRRAATPLACRPPYGRDASHQSQQPTCCHEYPRYHPIPKLRALALPTAAILLVHPSGWEPSLPLEAILGDARLPLLALQPWVDRAVGAAPASCYQTLTPEGMRGVPRLGSSGLCRPASSPMVRLADAPCRYPQPSSASRAHPREPEPASSHPNQRVRLFELKAPSTSKSHRRRPSSRPTDDRMGRHWYPGFAASGPASDTLSRPNPRSARSCCLPTIHRGPRATCRLPASAMDCHPSTPTCRPISNVVRGKPRPAR